MVLGKGGCEITADIKRVLFVSHSFPPFRTPEAILSSRTVRALTELGWEVTVLTIDEASCLEAVDRTLIRTVPSTVEIVRTPSVERSFVRIRYLPLILQRLGLPELQFLWYPSAVRKGIELLRHRSFDVIHSWACFHVSNLVGLALKRASGLPWVAHFSDPWVDSPYFNGSSIHRLVAGRFEKAIIREADRSVFVTSQTVDLVMNKYPSDWKNKVHVIPHGFDPDAVDVSSTHTNRPHDRLRLMYTGSFYKGKRTPMSLLRALHDLNHDFPLIETLEMTFIGPIVHEYQEAAERFGLSGVVTFQGSLSFAECMQATLDADVLVVIDAPSESPSVFLPSKLVEYLPFRRLILGITPSQGASADLLRRLGCPVIAPEDVKGIRTAIASLIKRWQSGQWILPSQFEKIALEYDIRRTTKTLADMFDSLRGRSG